MKERRTYLVHPPLAVSVPILRVPHCICHVFDHNEHGIVLVFFRTFPPFLSSILLAGIKGWWWLRLRDSEGGEMVHRW